jgi:hypothetical protein
MFLLWDSLSTEHVVKQLFAHGHLFDHFLIAARCAKIDFCGPLEDQKNVVERRKISSPKVSIYFH